MFNPSARFEDAVTFGVECGPGSDTAKEGTYMDEVDGGGAESPCTLVSIVNFEVAIRWRPFC